ncbi:PAS domain S-box protein [Hydrogenophaga sp.]|uniref:PAS domain S-box protein n=1 Tax=Hydrogenophaga sp. TaxID=1904254 RepID=UPI003566D8FB
MPTATIKNQQRQLLVVTVGAILLLLGSVGFFAWLERQRDLDSAAAVAGQRVARLAEDLSQSLALAQVAIAQAEAARRQVPALPVAELQREALRRTELLAALPLPFDLHALDAQGRVIDPHAPSDERPPHTHALPSAQSEHWQIGDTQGPPSARYIPLVWSTGSNAAGVAGYAVDLTHQALLRRYEADRPQRGSGVALFRLEPDGSLTVLARVPLVESEIGKRVRGPLAQALQRAPMGSFDDVTQIDGRRRVVAYQRLEGAADGLVIGHGMATQAVLAEWTASLPYLVGISLLLAAGMGFGGWRFARSLSALSRSHYKLAHSEQQLRTLAGNLPDMVVRYDQTGRHVYANPAVLGATGLMPRDFIGKTDTDLGMSAEGVATLTNSLRRVFSSGQTERLELELPGPDGMQNWESLVVLEPPLGDAEPTALVISRNITERRRTEEALRASEQRFRLAASFGQVWDWDIVGKGINFPVDSFWLHLGLVPPTPAEAVSALEALMFEEDRPRWREALRRHWREREPYSVDFRVHDAQGRVRWFLTQGQAVWDASGQATYMAGTTFEITERRLAEQALRTNEEMLRQFFDSELVGMAITVPDKRWQQFNARLCEMLGYSNEQLQKVTWADITHPDDLPRDLAQFNKVLAGEIDNYRMDKRYIRSDGTTLHAAIAVHCQRDAHSHPLRLYAIVEDIGARKEAEARLAQQRDELEHMVQRRTVELALSEARYRHIFETAPVGLAEEDWSEVQYLLRELRASGVTDGPAYFAEHPEFVEDCLHAVHIVHMNKKGLALHGATVLGRDIPDLSVIFPTPEDRQHFTREIEALWRGDRLYTAPRHQPSASGTTTHLMITLSLPKLDEDDGMALVSMVDITEIDRLHAELDDNVQRLGEANAELEAFTYTVSHDLKAPLRGISGYAALLVEEQQHQLDAEGQEHLQRILHATNHMTALINDLLAYSRMERQEKVLTTVVVEALVSNVLDGLRNVIDLHGVQVQSHLHTGLKVWANSQDLAMVLRNLIDNAVKFSRPDQTPSIAISANSDGDRAQIAVRDNGMGFDMKYHDRIFTIFQRLHRSEDYSGTGIGLAMVRKAMERMGGSVRAESEPGLGTTFFIDLPLAR